MLSSLRALENLEPFGLKVSAHRSPGASAMQNRQARKTLCLLALTTLLSAACPQILLAEPSVSIYQKLGEYEQVLFGTAQGSQPIEKRLQNLEKQLFGKAEKNSDTSKRLANIEKVMTGSAYLPPVAPEMDRSEFAPTPKQAPSNPTVQANEISDPLDAPQVADSSDRVKGLLRQAMQLYSQGKIAEAEKVYRTVLGIDFRNTDANYNLGAIAESKGDLAGAQRFYSTAAKTSPSDPDIQEALVAVQNKLKSRPAQQQSASAPAPAHHNLAGGPTTADDKRLAAEASAAYKNGNFDEAIIKLNQLSQKNRLDANIQFALGQAYRGKGNHQESIRHLRAAAALDPKKDLYRQTLNQAEAQMDEQQIASNDSRTPSSSSPSSSSGPTGEITPFAGLPSSGGDEFGISAADNYLRRNGGSPSMLEGGIAGFGGGSGMGFSGASFGFPLSLGTSPNSTRLRRAVQASLAGAAMGAMSNRGMPGGMSRGAMRGAMQGGLYGLLLGF